MTCGEFLARHSEYLDEELAAEAALEMRLHLAGCARCARYDRVLRRGLTLLREMEPVQPARDPLAGFPARLVAAPLPREEAPPRVPIAATVAVAGVVALVAWSALFRLAGVPGTVTGEPVRGGVVRGQAELVGADVARGLPAFNGVGLVGAARPTNALTSPSQPILPSPIRIPGLERGEPVTRAIEARGTGDLLLPLRPRFLVPGPYTPLLLQAPEFGERAEAINVSAPGPR